MPGLKPEYPISAVDDNTPPAPTSPWILPGQYRVVLTVEGQKYIRPLTVEMDPRVKTSLPDLQKQFDLSQQVYQSVLSLQPVVEQAAAARTQLNAMRARSSGAEAAKLEEVSKQLATLEGGGRRRRGWSGNREPDQRARLAAADLHHLAGSRCTAHDAGDRRARKSSSNRPLR